VMGPCGRKCGRSCGRKHATVSGSKCGLIYVVGNVVVRVVRSVFFIEESVVK
jgi:hypothetical protein